MISPPPTPSTLSPSPLLEEIPGPTSKISNMISPPTSPTSLFPSPNPPVAFHRRTSNPPSPSQSTSSLSSDAGGASSVREHLGSKFSSTSNNSTAPTSVRHFSTLEALDSSIKVNIMDDKDVVLSMDLCRFHAGDRLPADPFWRPRWEMSNIHVALWNGLDQVYRHAPFVVGPEERLAFSQFASSVVHAIDTHHDLEEEYYFPSLEVAISMQTNLEGHASFDDGIRALKFYLRACLVDPSIFDAQTITDIIDLFAVHLASHFADELNTLDPDILRDHFSTKDLDKQGSSLQKHIIKDYKRHLYTALPVLIISTPPGREWPLLSPLVRRILIPLVLGRKYKSSWKYGKWPNQLKVFSGSKPPSKSLKTLPEVSEDKILTARTRLDSIGQDAGGDGREGATS
ncbi:hypothetical protein BDY24DRAFT_400332 [Mrakia frigida]|uniref:hemerythrin domain-containing protein n=1 Tax=Mrakia frigida TaxID=29902 RepID=UPI003FCBEF3C